MKYRIKYTNTTNTNHMALLQEKLYATIRRSNNYWPNIYGYPMIQLIICIPDETNGSWLLIIAPIEVSVAL
jgi:hypothetical protein